MAEQIDPPVPVVVAPPSVKVIGLNLDWDAQTIIIRLRGADGTVSTQTYGPADGAGALLIALNKANLTVQSLHRRILAKLIADNRIQGTISGAPD